MLLWERTLREEYRARLVSPAQVRQHQNEYILCFSFFDLNELPTLRPEPGSLYLYSSCEAFNEEMQCDFGRLRAWLEHFRMRAVGLPLKESDWDIPKDEQGLHASGHADPKGLIDLIQEISPAALIPIHTTQSGVEFFQDRLRGTSIIIKPPSYGCPVELG